MKQRANIFYAASMEALRNGSCFRSTGRKREAFAHYMNGDFIGFRAELPSTFQIQKHKREVKDDRCTRSPRYQGKQIGDDFLYITHDEDKLLTICCPDDRSQEEQADLIAEFFSIFDALNEIGYETLDPAPQ